MLSEDDIIARLKKKSPDFIGDDAAVIPITDDKSLIISKDLLVEDIHFRRRYFDPESLAHKAINVNLSDIAAMGATPKYIMLGCAIPTNIDINYISSFFDYFSKKCLEYNIILIGGDTCAAIDKLTLSITIIADFNHGNIIKRDGAVASDIICVAGNIGYAKLGLYLLENDIQGHEKFKMHLLRPNALMAEGKWLAESNFINAMMDISDGLYLDLTKLCKESACGAEIILDDIKIEEQFIDLCKKLLLDPMEYHIVGGEDYALLFTTSADNYLALSQQFQKEFAYPLIKIGIITTDNKAQCTSAHEDLRTKAIPRLTKKANMQQSIKIKKGDKYIKPYNNYFYHF